MLRQDFVTPPELQLALHGVVASQMPLQSSPPGLFGGACSPFSPFDPWHPPKTAPVHAATKKITAFARTTLPLMIKFISASRGPPTVRRAGMQARCRTN